MFFQSLTRGDAEVSLRRYASDLFSVYSGCKVSFNRKMAVGIARAVFEDGNCSGVQIGVKGLFPDRHDIYSEFEPVNHVDYADAVHSICHAFYMP